MTGSGRTAEKGAVTGPRRPLVAGNWKMHGRTGEGASLARRVAEGVRAVVAAVDVVVCPPFTILGEVASAIAGAGVILGAQNVHWEDMGAFTGEIAAPMLLDLGCRVVIVGHSERREHFGDTDETVRRRLETAVRHGLLPILCVGESWNERQNGRTEERVGQQLRAALATPPAGEIAVAYEPLWAIGSGRAASGGDAQEVAAFIRRLLGEILGPAAAARTRILYGGSVKPENMAEFSGQPDIDGALVGGASLKAETFAGIVGQALTHSPPARQASR